ncbi:hypothetical protein [Nonomuraea pusilla]|uniref:Serine/threonine protein kinase n=1 Tax=Nonomuraea pusilla TaxID=46177 RepID=A0A1H7S8J5_9ACTN|nr:hypothetical protein [Nonomuraea pusilla]SEL68629.1 serine/threonine protein kinase [Nonomuraea pusilla]
MRRLVLAWAATAVAATAAAVAVLGPIGTGVTGGPGRVLEPAEVRAALATARSAAVGGQASPLPTAPPATASEDAQARPATSPEPDATDAAVSTAPGEDDSVALVRSPGGTVVASCEGDLVTLRSWSPAQGYSVDGVEPGPTRQARVEFEPDEGHDVELRITCVAGRPLAVRH